MTNLHPFPVRSAARLTRAARALALGAAATLAAACATRERAVAALPAPDPLDERALVDGTDTSYVLASPSMQFVATSRRALRGGAPTVAGVEQRFEAMFGGPPPDISVVLIDSATPQALRLAARPPSGLPTVMYIQASTKSARRTRRTDVTAAKAEASASLALAAAHGWMRAYADAWTEALGGFDEPSAGASVSSDFLDPRLPDWIHLAALYTLVDGSAPAAANAALRAHPDAIVPLAALFTTPIAAPDAEVHALLRAPAGAADSAAAYLSEATSVLAYLRLRTGADVVGRVVPALMDAHGMDEILAALPEPTTVDGFERDWRAWLIAGPAAPASPAAPSSGDARSARLAFARP